LYWHTDPGPEAYWIPPEWLSAAQSGAIILTLDMDDGSPPTLDGDGEQPLSRVHAFVGHAQPPAHTRRGRGGLSLLSLALVLSAAAG
jgi:hypothetical protein